MKIIIHQAICGEQNKGWNLLQTTLSDNATAKNIAFKTDLQDSPPTGFPWNSIIRGFLFNDYYLIVKTFPDTSDEVRPGRVFSHCLIIEKKDLKWISDLSKLFSFCKNEIDKTSELKEIYIETTNEAKVELPDSIQPRFNKIIKVVVGLKNDTTILWVGQGNYEIATCKFWEILPPSQREFFFFGINFNPNDLPKGKLNFIVIPESLEAKYESKNVCIIRKNESVKLTEFSEKYLSGEGDVNRQLTDFKNAIESIDLTTDDISIISKVIPTFEKLSNVTDLKMLNNLANVISKYSPDNQKGIAIKKQLLDVVVANVITANEKDIFILKMFPINSFNTAENIISKSTKQWIQSFLCSVKSNESRDLTILINQIYQVQSPNWWTKLFQKEIENFVSTIKQATAKIIWLWIKKDITVFKYISKAIENSTDSENVFIDTFPDSIGSSITKDVKSFAIKRKWWKLHAKILKTEFSFEEAIVEQLKVDTNIGYDAGIEIITKDVDAKEIMDFAVSNGDERLVSLATELCFTNSSLLERMVIENINWQKIWFQTILQGAKITNGIKNPQDTINKLLDLIIKGKEVNPLLLEKLSETDFANILEYHDREKIWGKLSIPLRKKFLQKTSIAFLEFLTKNSTTSIPMDKELSEYITSELLGTFLYNNKQNIKSVLPIFSAYKQIPESALQSYVQYYSGKLDVVDGTQLGKLILGRNYKITANAIYGKALINKSFKIPLGECCSLLDFKERAVVAVKNMITKVEITEVEWWVEFLELCCKLYGTGPLDNGIWMQAEGEESDLTTRVSGREAWIRALKKLSQGGCSKITVKKLLKAMLNEYPKNNELLTLKDLWKKI